MNAVTITSFRYITLLYTTIDCSTCTSSVNDSLLYYVIINSFVNDKG